MLILTSSFATVADKLREKKVIGFDGKNVAFIPSAADPYQDKSFVEKDRDKLSDLGCEVYDVHLKGIEKEALYQELERADIIFVAGGNVTYLAEQMRQSGFMEMIGALLSERDYIGSSAGSILLGPTVEPFYAEDIGDLPKDFKLSDYSGLGLVPYVLVPHVNEPIFAKENDEIVKNFGNRHQIKPLNDDEYLVEKITS